MTTVSPQPKTLFTVIGKRKVYRVAADSMAQLTQALRKSGIVWQAIHEDKDATPEALAAHFNG